ncbi:MAG: glycosyltransferase family 4 protein [Candidatus Aenigmatarchaeota archaeon]
MAHFSWESLHSIAVGGISPVVTELAAAQHKAGHEVHVFTRMGPGQSPYENINGVHYHRCSFAFNPDLIQEMHNMCKSMVHEFFRCEDFSGKFDIIHGHDWHVVPALDEIKKARGHKIVFHFHSTQYGRDGNRFNGGAAEAIRGLEWYGSYIADRVIALTHTFKEEIKWVHRIPEDKIRILHNGIHAHKFNGWINPAEVKARYHIGPLDPTILFIGRITYMKGPDLLMEAIPEVLREFPHAKFIFAGDGDMKHWLERRAHELGIAHAVRFTGWINDFNQKSDLYKSVDAVCVPSRNEPFGVVVLEAWSAGKPVIATHGTGAGEIVWHEVTGVRVYQTPNSIAWGIKYIFSDFERARWMGRNGRRAAEEAFNWDNIAKHLDNFYREIV